MGDQKFKRLFYRLLHFNYIVGTLYALGHFLRTPRQIIEPRRLWAYETWIILSFWGIFTTIYFIEQQKLAALVKARRIILANLILLVFPWGIFLLISPQPLMTDFGLSSVFWRILGGCSLVGALVYYYPYRFWERRFARFILAFGFFDNLVTAFVILMFFLARRVPFIALGSVPLLLYFSIFFLQLFRYHRRSVGR
jgi:hypothetical protein